MTNPNQTQPAPQNLDETSLDLVVGAGVVMPDLRKQEQSDKLGGGDAGSARVQEEAGK